MDDEERVVELDLPWQPDAGAPHPVVRQDEARLVVVYRAAHPAVGPFVRLQFDSPLCSIFGYPNDEALAGHPLYEVGLGSYGLYEVLSSAWLRELRGRNLTCFPNSTWWPDPPHESARRTRHFVVTFHDSMLECLAAGLAGSFVDDPRPV